eukprot:CAMPEP_0172304198 /NCGR_PEP_ID=MMETSP1058-20130122/5632_1 /TAXON_ID=83371 /ORGANISM="Detonula confervacea, Strain CCMP 353" /LENGTH=326 /DNA_ID=CAMNT_0013015323 /DNA_START=11 /DNA_END=991 /DNA_ORIENTATION=+
MPSSNLEDLTLSNENGATGNNAVATEEEADPWAVLAAAAGEEAPPPTPSTTHAETAVPATTTLADHPPTATAATATALSHAEGETFTMADLNNNNQHQQQQPPSLAAQIQSSTANLSSALTTKIQQVDAKTGISTKAHTVDEKYHISEKWSHFQTDVLKPTTEKTRQKTKEVSTSVKEKVGPSVKEHWGSIKQRSTEMGITQKWSSLSSKVGSKWHETSAQVGESVEHWKEEQEKKRALANSSNGNNNDYNGEAAREQQQQQFQQNLEGAKEKVVERWTGGVSWVSQRIQAAKQQSNGGLNGGEFTDRETKRMDSDGLPSSFRRDG